MTLLFKAIILSNLYPFPTLSSCNRRSTHTTVLHFFVHDTYFLIISLIIMFPSWPSLILNAVTVASGAGNFTTPNELEPHLHDHEYMFVTTTSMGTGRTN
uniref:Uncharacterized protein n=1 Tax=Glycine max TaxID=3847 RepID=A0A0R0I5T3_SOYBN